MLEQIHKIVWGPWLMALFLAAGVFYTVRSHGFQVRGFPIWWRATVGSFFWKKEGGARERKAGREEDGAEESAAGGRRRQFKTACTALAATVGTGNIVGVATAITCGGPGALFWMWVSAGIGMMTAYGEVYLGIASRFRDREGNVLCGPFVYLGRLARKPLLAAAYGILCLASSLGMGAMVQANSVAETLAYAFSFPKIWGAAALTILIALIIRGGKKQIGSAAEKLIPFSAGLYILFSLAVLCLCRRVLPEVLSSVFREAFRLKSAAGGASGYGISLALRYGLARGVFSNEAGLGSLAVLHGESPGEDPKLQGMWAMFEVFFDTVIVCTLTGLVVLCGLKEGGLSAKKAGITGAALTSWCFSRYLGEWGESLVSLSLILFAFATIIAWHYLGSQSLAWLAGKRLAGLYQMLYLAAVAFGGMASLGNVWLLADIVNGLMALPNLMALFLLAGSVTFPEGLDK